MSILENAAKKAKYSGSMVAFFIPTNVGKNLQRLYRKTSGDMVQPRDMHITIGLVRGFEGKERKIRKVLDKVAEDFKPTRCKIESFGSFPPSESNENKWVLYAKPEFLDEDIQDFRDYCHQTMKKYNIEIDNGSFEFSPHITLKYCEEEPELKNGFGGVEFVLNSIHFAAGNKRWESRLG